MSPSPFLRKHASLRGRGGAPQAGQPGLDERDGYVPQPANRTSVGMILFWVGLAAALVIALIMFATRGGSGPGGVSTLPPLYAEIKYNGIARVFQVTNEMRFALNNVQFTLETSQGTFTTTRGSLSPNEAVTLQVSEFGGSGGSPGMSAVPTKLTTSAQLPNGQRVQRVDRIGGARPPAPGDPSAPAKTPQPSGDEGGAIVE